MNLLLERDEHEIRAGVVPQGNGFIVTLDGRAHRIEGSFGQFMQVLVDGRPVEATVRHEGSSVIVERAGVRHEFRIRDARAPRLGKRRAGADRARGELHAPMPGLVIEILVSQGERVETGQPVLVVEAMKMQNALTAPLNGRVGAVRVEAGEPVESGQLLLAIEPEG